MLSSAKIGTSSWRYYTTGVACRASEYYLGVGEAPGRWQGRGLEQLGLSLDAVVSERELEALFARGLHPGTGERLGRAWRSDGVTGFDLTFSAPKSVSALWALGDGATAAGALAAHRAAVGAGLAYLDAHASLSRRGTDGVEQVGSAGLVAAVFDHRTSRAGDPQLHTHALLLNKVRCEDGRWRSLDATELFHHKKSAGMIYQAALRNEMHRRLGVLFGEVNENGQADVVGVPEGLLRLWSKRTARIDSEAALKLAEYEAVLGRTLSPAERVGVVKTAVLKTRPGKQHPALSALHATWVAEAARTGWTPGRLRRAVRPQPLTGRAGQERLVVGADPVGPTSPARAPRPVQAQVDRAGPPAAVDVLHRGGGVAPRVGEGEPPGAASSGLAASALQAAGTRRAVFSRADVAGQVAAHLPASGSTAAQVLGRVEWLTDVALRLQDAVPVGRPGVGVTSRASDARYATVQVLSSEARILDLAARGRRGGYGQVSPTALTPTGPDAARLDAGQYRAVLALTAGGDFLSVLTAPAGAGKTSTLGAAARAWHDAGFRVVGLAPSARAAAELAAATGGPADTLAKWLHSHPSAAVDAGRVDVALDDRTVVIVDEASMASTLDLDPLVRAAARAAAKVVLVGDPAQIGVVNGPGGMLAALSAAGHGVELAEIHRFRRPWERQASLGLRHGKTEALAAYRAAGRLHACLDGDAALDGVFGRWAAAQARGQDALMLARTRRDVDALNERARAAALAAGTITGPVTAAGGRAWQAGDVLRARRNDRRLTVGTGHVRNGDRFAVLGPGPLDGLIVEDLTGRGRAVLPAAYLTRHAEYGWASTIDAAQGATADVGVVLVRPRMDREHLYVAMTRGRDSNHAYITPDVEADDSSHDHGYPRPHLQAVDDLQQQAERVLQDALTRRGAQDTAHAALEQARNQVAQAASQAVKVSVRALRAGDAADPQRRERPLPAEHTRALEQLLAQYRSEREQLHAARKALHGRLRQTQAELDALPWWARGRRHALTETLSSSQHLLTRTEPTQLRLDAEIDRLTRQVAQHTRQRQASDQAATRPQRPAGWDLGRAGGLARPLRAPAVIHGLPTPRPQEVREPHLPAGRDRATGRSR